MSQPCTHTGHSPVCKITQSSNFFVYSETTQNLAHHHARHGFLLPVVYMYLHVLRTCVLLARNARWTCTAQSSCTYVMYSTCILCMAKVRDKRCSQSGVLGTRRCASAIARLLPNGLMSHTCSRSIRGYQWLCIYYRLLGFFWVSQAATVLQFL